MAGCSGTDCEWVEYRAIGVHIVKSKFTGDDACDEKVKKALRKRAIDDLKQEVSQQEENTTPCEPKTCECVKTDVDDDDGWNNLDEGRLTRTISEGSCQLKATVTYQRQSRKVPGHCYKPKPKSPEDEEPGEDEPRVKGKKDDE